MIAGRYTGHSARTGSALALTSDGVIRASAVKRLPESERWSREGLDTLKGVPWDIVPRARRKKDGEAEEQEDLPATQGEEGKPLQLPVMPGEKEQAASRMRRFYVTKADVEKYQATPNCPGCAMVTVNGSTWDKENKVSVPHNDTCRERMMRMIAQDAERSHRIDKFKDKERQAADRASELNADDAAGAPKRRKTVQERTKRRSEEQPEEKESKVLVLPDAAEGAEPKRPGTAEEFNIGTPRGSPRGGAGMDIEDLINGSADAAPTPNVQFGGSSGSGTVVRRQYQKSK